MTVKALIAAQSNSSAKTRHRANTNGSNIISQPTAAEKEPVIHDLVALYRRDVTHLGLPCLTAKEVRALSEQIRKEESENDKLTDEETKNNEARNKLVLHNLPFAIAQATIFSRKAQRHSSSADDIDRIGEANRGLIRAADREFDPRQSKYTTRAGWKIRGQMSQYSEKIPAIRIPRSSKEAADRVQRLREDLIHELEREPTSEEMKKEIVTRILRRLRYNRNEEQLHGTFEILFSYLREASRGREAKEYLKRIKIEISKTLRRKPRLDEIKARFRSEIQKIADNSEMFEVFLKLPTTASLPEDNILQKHKERNSHSPLDNLVAKEDVERMRSAVDALEERERTIMELRFPRKIGSKPRTLKEIGRILGLTRERVRQIEAETILKLRGLLNANPASPME